MNIENVFTIFHHLHEDNLSFLYQGSFNDEITERIIDISETSISSNADLNRISRKVSFLLAECFQNIIRHGEFSGRIVEMKSAGIFVTRSIGQAYYISSANLVSNKDIDELKQKIETLNKLSTEELKKLYIEVLTNNQLTNKGGAGLGLIEMARKSGQKLEYDFEQVDEEYSYFYLQIRLNVPQENLINSHQIDLNSAKEFHRLMADDNIFIIHKGDFSSHTIIPILRMIEDNLNFQNEVGKSKKKIIHLLVELLQNVSKHGFEENGIREAIFMMGKTNGNFLIFSGNYIENQFVNQLSNYLDYIKQLSKDQLIEYYKNVLNVGTLNEKGNAGLGLINIARDASKLDYEFKKIDEIKSFFSLGIMV